MKPFLFFATLIFATAIEAQVSTNCDGNYDGNCDGAYNVNDILGILGLFGTFDYDHDGINDEIDDCIDDGCGFCDGPGPSVLVIEDIITTYDSVYLLIEDDYFVFVTSLDTSYVLLCEVFGCTDLEACNYNPLANLDDLGCLYEDVCGECGGDGISVGICDCEGNIPEDGYDCDGVCLSDADGDGICDQFEIAGCTDVAACNYNGEATEADGSCDFMSCSGCMNPTACNFDLSASLSDDSCDFESCAGCMDEMACNYDSAFTISIDLLCDYSSCLGCLDSSATNYNPSATIDDGSCFYGPLSCDGQYSVNYHGIDYEIVEIGEQCWFVQELQTQQYLNGDSILSTLNNYWHVLSNSTDAAGVMLPSSSSPVSIALYNFYAILDSRGLCPTGWHVSTDSDFMELEMTLGMSFEEASASGLDYIRGIPYGWDLKATPGPEPAWDGYNTYGFTAVRTGYVSSNNVNNPSTEYWTWSPNLSEGQNSYIRKMSNGTGGIGKSIVTKSYGCAIRCVKN